MDRIQHIRNYFLLLLKNPINTAKNFEAWKHIDTSVEYSPENG